MTEQTVHLIVQGKVQGVGFRWFVVQHARRLGLGGWVRNRADGAVELFAAGDADALRELENELSRGPDGARVDRVDRLGEIATAEARRPFSIVRDRSSP